MRKQLGGKKSAVNKAACCIEELGFWAGEVPGHQGLLFLFAYLTFCLQLKNYVFIAGND